MIQMWNTFREYPYLEGVTYLDHEGGTLCANSLLGRVTGGTTSDRHLGSSATSPHSTFSFREVETVCEQMEVVKYRILCFLKVDPFSYDLNFVSNTTAAVRLAIRYIQCCAEKEKAISSYYYHQEACARLVDLRESCNQYRCFRTDEDVDRWIEQEETTKLEPQSLGLFVYPGQSSVDGRRLPKTWVSRIRNKSQAPTVLTLLDASSLASTGPLELFYEDTAPDFVAISFQKIFGYPELGALLVRRDQSWSEHSQHHIREEAVMSVGGGSHVTNNILSQVEFEEGRLDLQSVIGLGHAIDVHRELYGPDPMEAISRRTTSLTQTLVRKLQELVHGGGEPVVRIYKSNTPDCWSPSTHGPVVAINVTRADGSFVDCRAVQEAAASRKISVGNLALWDYGGVAANCQWNIARIEPARWLHSGQEMVISGLPTGVIRVSLGAMSTEVDVLIFVNYISAFYVERHNPTAETILRKVEAWRMDVVAAQSAT